MLLFKPERLSSTDIIQMMMFFFELRPRVVDDSMKSPNKPKIN